LYRLNRLFQSSNLTYIIPFFRRFCQIDLSTPYIDKIGQKYTIRARNSLNKRIFVYPVDTHKTTENKAESGLKRLLKNEYSSLFFIFILSITLLSAKGHGKEDQNIFFNNFFKESAAYYDGGPQATVIDVNSLAAANIALGGRIIKDTIETVQQNSIIPYGSVIESLADLERDNKDIITYTVQEGDVLSLIARDYGVSTNSLVWANGLRNANAIQPGQELKIPPVSGIIHTVVSGDTVGSLANRYGAETNEIIEFNNLSEDGALSIGMDIVVPGGEITSIRAGSTTVRYAKTTPFANLPKLTGYYFHPTGGVGRVSQWFHGRNAIDIANPCGTSIYAAAEGQVTRATTSGWHGGYGRYIKISHPNGTATIYAHLWDVLVSLGQTVSKGQKIGTIGSTGLSTGCHIHFETHGAQNPVSY
jgi:murein DD-endopeptidase MepM/ murein hydrolase activator NlpD